MRSPRPQPPVSREKPALDALHNYGTQLLEGAGSCPLNAHKRARANLWSPSRSPLWSMAPRWIRAQPLPYKHAGMASKRKAVRCTTRGRTACNYVKHQPRVSAAIPQRTPPTPHNNGLRILSLMWCTT